MECYNRLPKRRGVLKYSPNRVGWELEVVEGSNWTFFLHCELFIIFADVDVVVLYCSLVRSTGWTSTAFSIGTVPVRGRPRAFGYDLEVLDYAMENGAI